MNKIYGKTGNGTNVVVEYILNEDNSHIEATISLASNGEIMDSLNCDFDGSNNEFIEELILNYLAEQEY